jgi:hypothetical protein
MEQIIEKHQFAAQLQGLLLTLGVLELRMKSK